MTVTSGGAVDDVTRRLTVAAGKGWREMVLTEACLGELGEGITIASDAPMQFSVSQISRRNLPEGTECSF